MMHLHGTRRRAAAHTFDREIDWYVTGLLNFSVALMCVLLQTVFSTQQT
jgi:hypothetical protein